jgi:predicted  nucleic acid-binding Zn-ribbon protein
MDYINKLRADIQQLEEQIEVLSAKIPDAIFKGTPQDLQSLLFDIDSLKSRLITAQSNLIRSLSNRLQSESDRLDRMLGVSK